MQYFLILRADEQVKATSVQSVTGCKYCNLGRVSKTYAREYTPLNPLIRVSFFSSVLPISPFVASFLSLSLSVFYRGISPFRFLIPPSPRSEQKVPILLSVFFFSSSKDLFFFPPCYLRRCSERRTIVIYISFAGKHKQVGVDDRQLYLDLLLN